jgi:hypothetical protein
LLIAKGITKPNNSKRSGFWNGLPADMVKWYHRRFPTFCRGFDSPYPHLNLILGEVLASTKFSHRIRNHIK